MSSDPKPVSVQFIRHHIFRGEIREPNEEVECHPNAAKKLIGKGVAKKISSSKED